MAKFRGVVGYVKTIERDAGCWESENTERTYSGDVLRNTRRWEKGEHLNDDININNMISIIADKFANENFYAMKYVKWAGVAWKITNVEIARPRFILTLGGVYNGE